MRDPYHLLRTRCVLLAATLGCGLTGGCENLNQGIDPPQGTLFFPAGLVLDPRATQPEPATRPEPVRYLMVVNGNNDLAFNAGAVTVIDTDRFFALWRDDDGDGVYPYCETDASGAVLRGENGELVGRCVLDPGSAIDADHPCRRLPLTPQVVECDEGPLVVDGASIGNFATVAGVSHGDTHPRLWIPVRGDPSVTYFDVKDGPDGAPDLDCGQARDENGFAADDASCSDAFRLTHLRNDTSLLELPREPFNILITETPHYRYGFVAHSAGAGLTLIDLDGLGGSGGRPAITDIVDLFLPTSGSGIRAGGFGLAARPCSVEDGNAPSITQGCTRPLVYASLRFQLSMISFTASGLDDTELPANAADRDSCYGDIDGDGVDEFVGPFCASPDEVGQACAVICEPTVQAARRLDRVGGIDPFSPIQSAALGDVVFGDARGDALYVIETNPGALIKMNTALDFDAEPFDISSAPPIELCAEPNRMTIWNDMAFVTCFRAAYIFVIDLRSFQVIDTIITGTGPHDLVVDSGRLVLYAANTLEGSVSVIDIDPTHATRFAEIARIGLQEPFSQ